MNDSPLQLVRPELRAYAGYSSARTESQPTPDLEQIWLNANESAWNNAADGSGAARRYPDPQPPRLRSALAGLYGCRPEQLLACRGSDEAIDLLVRVFCRPGGDTILTTGPTFGMYAVSAHLNGTRVVDVPLVDRDDALLVDMDAVGAAVLDEDARIVFLASPGNPSGALVPLAEVTRLAEQLAGHALIVVDEAYIEFSDSPSATTLLAGHSNIAVLRTLSKAHALAGARVGAVIAHPDVIAVLQRCQAPYPLPVPSVELACAALAPASLSATAGTVTQAITGRQRLAAALADSPGVTRVYRSAANFVLARFVFPQDALARLLAAGIVVRDMRERPGLEDALRISVGTPGDLDRVEQVLAGLPGRDTSRDTTRASGIHDSQPTAPVHQQRDIRTTENSK